MAGCGCRICGRGGTGGRVWGRTVAGAGLNPDPPVLFKHSPLFEELLPFDRRLCDRERPRLSSQQPLRRRVACSPWAGGTARRARAWARTLDERGQPPLRRGQRVALHRRPKHPHPRLRRRHRPRAAPQPVPNVRPAPAMGGVPSARSRGALAAPWREAGACSLKGRNGRAP